jgi:hypothetical protein
MSPSVKYFLLISYVIAGTVLVFVAFLISNDVSGPSLSIIPTPFLANQIPPSIKPDSVRSVEATMSQPDYEWPTYYVASQEHLQALGVISLNFNLYENGVMGFLSRYMSHDLAEL